VAYKLKLPIAWNIHDVFHASLLSPYHETTAHGPNFSRPSPDLIDGEEEFEVERVESHRQYGRLKCLQYLIKWKGYPDHDNTWEPADQIHADDLVKEYHQRRPTKGIKGRRTLLETASLPPCLAQSTSPVTAGTDETVRSSKS
jgi:hypothetical protein